MAATHTHWQSNSDISASALRAASSHAELVHCFSILASESVRCKRQNASRHGTPCVRPWAAQTQHVRQASSSTFSVSTVASYCAANVGEWGADDDMALVSCVCRVPCRALLRGPLRPDGHLSDIPAVPVRGRHLRTAGRTRLHTLMFRRLWARP